MTPEEFANKVTDIIEEEMAKLSPEEREQKLAAFKRTVDKVCGGKQNEKRKST